LTTSGTERPGQPVEDLGLQAAERERGGEQGVALGEASFRAHVEDGDLGPVQQRAADGRR
jgi:hypothetical protein